MLREQPFPDPVAWIHRGRAWLRSDIERFRRGEEPPQREAWELQGQVLVLADVARTLERPVGSLRRYVRFQRWDRMPRPAGRVGGTNYWWRADVERWPENAGAPEPDRRGTNPAA